MTEFGIDLVVTIKGDLIDIKEMSNLELFEFVYDYVCSECKIEIFGEV